MGQCISHTFRATCKNSKKSIRAITFSEFSAPNNNYHSYSTRNSQSLRTPIGKSEAIYQTFTYFGSLAWNYISSKIPTDVSYICFKNIAKLHLQSNNLPQIRLNV